MSFYPQSDMNEPLDVKSEAPAAKSGSDLGWRGSLRPLNVKSETPTAKRGSDPAARPFFNNSDHAVIADDVQTRGGAAAAAIAQPPDEQLSDKVKELREAPERAMYDSHKQYSGVFKRGTFQDALTGEDPAVVEQVDRFAAGVYSDFRLSNAEAQHVHDVFTTQVTDEVADTWRAESEAYIKSLGPEGPAKLALASELARRDPRVFKLLEGPHGNHPTLVKLLIEKAQAEKRDGRL